MKKIQATCKDFHKLPKNSVQYVLDEKEHKFIVDNASKYTFRELTEAFNQKFNLNVCHQFIGDYVKKNNISRDYTPCNKLIRKLSAESAEELVETNKLIYKLWALIPRKYRTYMNKKNECVVEYCERTLRNYARYCKV